MPPQRIFGPVDDMFPSAHKARRAPVGRLTGQAVQQRSRYKKCFQSRVDESQTALFKMAKCMAAPQKTQLLLVVNLPDYLLFDRYARKTSASVLNNT